MKIGKKPLIAATLHLGEELNVLPALADEKIIDAVEFRADRFYSGDIGKLKKILYRIGETNLPAVVTFRQGEIANLTEAERLRIISELLPEAAAVDIELDSEITGEAVKKAKSLGKTVIISDHDFEKTPSNEDLRIIFERSIAEGADVVKIAVMPRAPEDAARLMCFCMESSGKHPLICISMGEAGKFTRFYGPFFGSVLTYGSISEPIAPGQADVRELKRELGKFF